MNAIFMNSEKSKTSKPYALTLKLIDKLDSERGEKSVSYSIDHTLYQMFKIILSIFYKSREKILVILQ